MPRIPPALAALAEAAARTGLVVLIVALALLILLQSAAPAELAMQALPPTP